MCVYIYIYIGFRILALPNSDLAFGMVKAVQLLPRQRPVCMADQQIDPSEADQVIQPLPLDLARVLDRGVNNLTGALWCVCVCVCMIYTVIKSRIASFLDLLLGLGDTRVHYTYTRLLGTRRGMMSLFISTPSSKSCTACKAPSQETL